MTPGLSSLDAPTRSLVFGKQKKGGNLMISKEKKAAIIEQYGRKAGDTGSPEVQIAILTARIAELI